MSTSSVAVPPRLGEADPARPVAVIDIGTTSIRMAVAQIKATGEIHHLEKLSQGVSLGKDTFTRGSIQKNTIEACVKVLRDYRKLLQELQITKPSQIRVIATSAVREAANRMQFLDRIYSATGFEVEPLDEAEVTRITFMGVQPYLRTEKELADNVTVVVEVGGGSTSVLAVNQNDVAFSHSYRLGSLRLRETVESHRTPQRQVRTIMENHINIMVETIVQQLPVQQPGHLIALGGDMRYAVRHILPDWDRDLIAHLNVDDLERFTARMLTFSVDELVRKHQLSFPDAESLGPSLLANLRLAKALQMKEVLVTNVNLRDGMLQEMARGEQWTGDLNRQIIRSGLELGRKFEFDEAHSVHVANLSRNLFRQLQPEHRLDARYEIILYLAALLHEVGLFVSHNSFHKHTMYLIRNSEIFGLGKMDLLLVSLVARYHRRASPKPTHEGYTTLEREKRVLVAKLAGLLRVADALDHSRSQRIEDFTCSRESRQLAISVADVDDLSLEQLALEQKGSLFEETYGVPILLRKSRR